MNAILLSVPPEVCERIANGKQTLLLMKRIPKLDTPYKVYMYETKERYKTSFIWNNSDGLTSIPNGAKIIPISQTQRRVEYIAQGIGKVVSSFICRGIMHPNDSLKLMAKESCMSEEELDECAKGKTPYGLRITDLTIFDKPKELGEFKKTVKKCTNGVWYRVKESLTRPPATFCYVEELSE